MGDPPRVVTRDPIGVGDEANLGRLHGHSHQPKLCLLDWQYVEGGSVADQQNKLQVGMTA